jgi:AraC-like DNA-binding protein
MPVLALLHLSAEATLALRRSLPARGPWRVLRCRTRAQLERALELRLVEGIVFARPEATLAELEGLRRGFPRVPLIAFAPFRPDDGAALLACERAEVAGVLVEGVDNAVAGDLALRWSGAAQRRRALGDACRVLRLSDPLQREVWNYLLDRTDQPVRTAGLAASVGLSREHLSRQFGAGGAPNLKRVIDLTRVASAAWLLANPGYDAARVAQILRFANASHLGATARRIAGVATRGVARLGPRGVLAAFAQANTRSRV